MTNAESGISRSCRVTGYKDSSGAKERDINGPKIGRQANDDTHAKSND